MHKLLTILCSYSCQDNSSLHYNWYCIYSKYWLLKLQSGYLGCRQADETVAISGFLVTTCMALQKVPNLCMVTQVSVFCELVSSGEQTCIVPFPCMHVNCESQSIWQETCIVFFLARMSVINYQSISQKHALFIFLVMYVNCKESLTTIGLHNVHLPALKVLNLNLKSNYAPDSMHD